MTHLQQHFSFSGLIVAILAIAGCGGPVGDGFKGERGQVSGAITLDGQPLATGCQVLFIADTGGYTAGGVIQDGGKYTLVYGGGSGLPVGEYSVQIAPPIVNTENAAPVDPSQMAGQLKLNRKSGKEASESGPFPSRYGSTSTSGLKFTVAPNQNTADFKLEKSDAKK